MKKIQSYRHFTALILTTLLWVNASIAAVADEAVQAIREARISGGLIVQIGSESLELKELGERFHVRLLLRDAAAVDAARKKIELAGLSGRFTVTEYDGKTLPFADRVVNGLMVTSDECRVEESEIKRVLVPGGLFFNHQSSISNPQFIAPVPDGIDDWTHYLYDASGNAVSKDKEVGPPRSFRWRAAPRFLRSHNFGASFTGLVTDDGRVFHFLDEGTPLFDQGGATPRWSLVARDAFNGALLWRIPLQGYGQPFFEDVAGQAVPDYIWRSPLSLNRRMVVQGDKVYAALHYREGPLAILDAVGGAVLYEVDVGGIVDEIVANGDRVICRVRTEIPMPENDTKTYREKYKKFKDKGMSHEEARNEIDALIFDSLKAQPLERIVAVDAKIGKALWQTDAPHVGAQTLVMADGKVLFHNYEKLVCLDARSGRPVWQYDNPAENRRRIGARNLLGHLMVADGRVLWSSSAAGGGVCLDLQDGSVMWENNRMGTRGGFGAPTGLRVINGIIYDDFFRARGIFRLSDGKEVEQIPDIGNMLQRGHHVRCMMGKATERYLLLPMRGAEYVDLQGDNHMACDWIRGACSYGLMPANGLTYVTPDPCSCYAGARIIGFMALAASAPEALSGAPAPNAPERLVKGPAFGNIRNADATATGWHTYRADARRTARASAPLTGKLSPAWTQEFSGDLTQAVFADGKAYTVRKNTYELICLDAGTGEVQWRRVFPAALDGPPTCVGDALFIGCRDGTVYALRAVDGALAWRFRAAPLDRLTLDEDRLESLWPVHSPSLYHNGLVYCAAGRNSYLDGGIHLYALDPVSGVVRHHRNLEGPWPDKEALFTGVEKGDQLFKIKESEEKKSLMEKVNKQWATGYHVKGGVSDLLVTDGKDIFMAQNQFNAQLEHMPLQRTWHTGYTPMGGLHILAHFGIMEDFMFHRHNMMYDDAWPSYGTGPGHGARSGTLVAVGEDRAYSAQHFTGSGYATHPPGSGNQIVADSVEADNLPGDLLDDETKKRLNVYGGQKSTIRTDAALWVTPTPVIVRALLTASGPVGGERVFAAGVVEGKTKADWDRSAYFEGPGKLQVFNGADGKLLGEYDLPAGPVFDGMSADGGRLLIALENGQLVCFNSVKE